MTRALYVRTSTDDGDGLAQYHELAVWAKAQGWPDPAPLYDAHGGYAEVATVRGVSVYFDRGESGAKESRPAWDKLRAEVRRGRVRELAVTELSRLGRSVVSVVLALDELHAAGCRVVLLRQGLDYGTPVGRAVAAILAAVAQLERDQIRERIKAGVKRAREKGSRSGRPIGRPRARVPAGAIKNAIGGLAAGRTWAEVARDHGIPETTLRRAVEAHQNPAKNQK